MKQITEDELRHMEGKEGLILQGCGGDLTEWVEGINDMLTVAGILKRGTAFDPQTVCCFQHGNQTNLLFPFDGSVKLEIGKLAMWRLETYEHFGGTWLSDYVPNRLGGFLHPQERQAEQQTERAKPLCPLIGQNGNIFHLMGIAARTLKENGMGEEAREMTGRILGGDCHSYAEALGIISEYVEPTDMLSERAAPEHKRKEQTGHER